jgi:hypothetical protein
MPKLMTRSIVVTTIAALSACPIPGQPGTSNGQQSKAIIPSSGGY